VLLGLSEPEVLFRQLHEETLASFPAPSIAINAADQPFAVMVDFDERAIAFLADADMSSPITQSCLWPAYVRLSAL
jgi:hypothetical protein